MDYSGNVVRTQRIDFHLDPIEEDPEFEDYR